MYLLRIAVRNLFRRKRRTFIISGVLALAIFFGLLMDSFMGGMLEISFGNIIDFDTAHMEVGRSGFLEEEREFPLDELFAPREDLISDIKALDGFKSLTPVINFSASIIAGREEFPVRVRALEPQSFKQVFRTQEYVVEGEFVESGDTGLVVGSDLAEMMGLEVGDFYTLRFRDHRDSFNTMQGEVKGIVTTPHPDMNLSTVYVDREYAVQGLGVGTDEISQLMVRMEDRSAGVSGSRKIEGIWSEGNFAVNSWEDASETLLALREWGEIEIYFMMALIVLVGAIGIINLIVLSSIERITEIGMMKAMGLKEFQIVKIFLLEAGGVGALGGIMGSLLSVIGITYLSKVGIDLHLIYGDAILEMGMPIRGRMYGTWNFSWFIFFFIFSVVIALLASIVPSYWAARKNPVDAIHHR